MPKGPHINLNSIELYARLDTSFRIITSYHSESDQIITRLDIKLGNEQYHTAFCSGHPIQPPTGSKILPENDLITPSAGIIQCINLKVSKSELIRALKELLTDIDK